MESQEIQLQELRKVLKDIFATYSEREAAREAIFRIINEKEVKHNGNNN